MASTNGQQLDEVEAQILEHFEGPDGRRSHTQEIADAAGVTRHTASKYLSVLEAKGLVGHDQVGNAKIWYPITDEVTLRSMESEDFEGVMRVAEGIRGIGDQEDGGLTNFRDELRSQLVEDTAYCVCAETNGEIVGFIIGDERAWEFGSGEKVGWIRMFGVHPDYRGKGIGRMLGEEIMGRFEEAGVKSVRTIVGWDRSDLLPYFHSLGFDMQESTVLERTLTDASGQPR